jgi:hypothetical protein
MATSTDALDAPRTVSRARQRLLSHRKSLEDLDKLGAISLADDYSCDGDAASVQQQTIPNKLNLETSTLPASSASTARVLLSARSSERPSTGDSTWSRRLSDDASLASTESRARHTIAASLQGDALLTIMGASSQSDCDSLLLAADAGDLETAASLLGIEERSSKSTSDQGSPTFHPDDARSVGVTTHDTRCDCCSARALLYFDL